MSSKPSPDAKSEIDAGQRFGFGANWARFLKGLDEERILEAEKSLRDMLECQRLDGLRFLDAGSGSGLFSLAARRLGAQVVSFDFDANSVACTRHLQDRFFSQDSQWQVLQGSVLDQGFLESLGSFDVVYSWGVLHHTGEMWRAIAQVTERCQPGGKVFLSIYNDQGAASRCWRVVKKFYCSSWLGRSLVLGTFVPLIYTRRVLIDLLLLRNPFARIREYKRSRGMSKLWDTVDWLGGYPFEVARPEAIFDYFRGQGFLLERLLTSDGYGCNQFVFRRVPAPARPDSV